jgi:SH3-like domain-containing protein
VQVTLAGEIQGQFASVTSAYGDGWVYTQVIGPDAPANPVTPEVTVTPGVTPEPTAAPTEVPGETGTRWTLEQVHLRAGPSTEAASISYLDAGVELQLTGEVSDGFAQVTSSFGTGWVFAQYIGATPPGETPTPAPETPTPEPETPEPAEPVTRWTAANVNLRSEADAASAVVSVLTAGTDVQFAGVTANGFSQVTASAGTGWVASEYLSETQPDVPAEPEPSTALISWPVTGGEWTMLQGYNGSSHQNRSSSWQYLYSLDLIRSDGSTAGQPIYSPVNGTMRWIDEVSGGGSIYMGDGLAFAFFHVVMDPSIQEGDTLTKGQYLGTIAPAGQFGAGSNPHLHISIWETSDGGNWSRVAIPFTGRVAIEGIEFPSNGSGNQWRGYDFTP